MNLTVKHTIDDDLLLGLLLLYLYRTTNENKNPIKKGFLNNMREQINSYGSSFESQFGDRSIGDIEESYSDQKIKAYELINKWNLK